MIQLLVFTGMIAIIQIEAVMVQAVSFSEIFQVVTILVPLHTAQPEFQLILVKLDRLMDMRSAEFWVPDC